jgi:hypothetical protein
MSLAPRTVAPMSFLSMIGVLTTVLLVAVPVGAAVLVLVLARGRGRTLGVVGFAIFAVEGLLGGAWLLLAPRLVRDTDVSVAALSGTYSLLHSLLAMLAVVLLALAIVSVPNRRSVDPRVG